MGAGRLRIMFTHILRNALAPVLVPITFGIAAAILIESGLSFLGFGASPPNPSWGTLLHSGRIAIQQMWWLILFPGLAIFLTVLAYNLIGEGLQEATDPRLRQAAQLAIEVISNHKTTRRDTKEISTINVHLDRSVFRRVRSCRSWLNR